MKYNMLQLQKEIDILRRKIVLNAEFIGDNIPSHINDNIVSVFGFMKLMQGATLACGEEADELYPSWIKLMIDMVKLNSHQLKVIAALAAEGIYSIDQIAKYRKEYDSIGKE